MNDKHNPFKWISSDPKLLISYCVYLDVLGLSNEMQSSPDIEIQNRIFNQFYNAFKEAVRDLRSFKTDRRPDIWSLKLFTDNIVLGCPAEIRELGHHEALFGIIVDRLMFFQISLLLKGYFVRGGWSLGQLYMDEMTVYGNALLEAYKMERKVENPCIYLTDSMCNLVTVEHLSYYSNKRHAPHNKELLKDDSGYIFINYLAVLLGGGNGPFFDELQKHKNIVEQKMDENSLDERIRKKYCWAADYHNYFCNEFIIDCPDKYFIDKPAEYEMKRLVE